MTAAATLLLYGRRFGMESLNKVPNKPRQKNERKENKPVRELKVVFLWFRRM